MTTGDAEQGTQPPSEQSPLLGARAFSDNDLDNKQSKPEGKITAIIWAVLAGVFVVGLIVVFAFPVEDWDDMFPSPEKILGSAPVIDGHIGGFIISATPSVSAYYPFISVHVTRLARARSSALCEQRVRI